MTTDKLDLDGVRKSYQNFLEYLHARKIETGAMDEFFENLLAEVERLTKREERWKNIYSKMKKQYLDAWLAEKVEVERLRALFTPLVEMRQRGEYDTRIVDAVCNQLQKGPKND